MPSDCFGWVEWKWKARCVDIRPGSGDGGSLPVQDVVCGRLSFETLSFEIPKSIFFFTWQFIKGQRNGSEVGQVVVIGIKRQASLIPKSDEARLMTLVNKLISGRKAASQHRDG